MSHLRQLRMALHVARYRLHSLHPFEVQASLTNRCNYHCVFCVCPTVQKAEMDTSQWTDTIRQLARHGTLRIKFQGGEPTLRTDFAELCAVAKAARIVTGVVTHGGHIAANPGLLDNLDEVVLSLDSVDPAVHDGMRGKGAHARALKTMNSALAAGKRVYINTVACRRTLDGLDALLSFCEARGVGMHAQPLNLGWHYADKSQQELGLTDAEIRDMHRTLAKWKREGRPLMFAAETYEGVAAWSDYREHTRTCIGVSRCMAGRDYIHIEPNGDIHPCGIHGGDFTPKNIVADGFVPALENANRHNCADCWIAYLNERKALFALKPYAVRAFLQRK